LLLLAPVLAAPLLVRVPPLHGTTAPQNLADPDSQFIPLNGLHIHYKLAGQGSPPIVLLHGVGFSLFTWREVLAPLAAQHTVLAFDRPAFGLTSRPRPGQWHGANPYSPEAAADQTIALLDALDLPPAVLVGNSAGGAIAALAALRHPERVRALALVGAAIYRVGTPAWVQPLLRTPQVRHLGPLLIRQLVRQSERFLHLAYHDPTRITPEALQGFRRPYNAHDWDMALWQLAEASRPFNSHRLADIHTPTLVLTGDDDHIVPASLSLRLARDLPHATLAVISRCGHLPQEECPHEFVAALNRFLARWL
jgi:pimeloyl-ACP methyl ester carboxylesterase